MSNEYFNVSGDPAPSSPGSSGTIRTVLSNISLGFDKLPVLSGNGLKLVRVNTAGTALESIADISGSITYNAGAIGGVTPMAGTFTTLVATSFTLGSVSNTEFSYLDGVTSAIQTQLDAKAAATGQPWSGTQNFTGATVTVAEPVTGTNPATKNYTDGLAFSTALPAQSGNAGKVVETNGTTASWGSRGMKLLATLTPTAAAAVNALTTFTSDYDAYLIVGEGIVSGSAGSLWMRLATAGTIDTGNNLTVGTLATLSTATTPNVVISNSGSVYQSGKGCNFAIEIVNVNDASALKSINVRSSYQSTVTPQFYNDVTGCSYAAANTVSGVGFLWSGGANFLAQGKIYIYGLVKV